MAGADDPAVVLEQFTQDASNLAPEITHLMEEIEAKDKVVRECEISIRQRDRAIQRQVKNSGVGSSTTPKEEADVKSVLAHYDTAVAHQDEKVALAEKACTLLARHTKRLDILIRELASNGGLEIDDALAALLNGTSTSSIGGTTRNGPASNGTPSVNGHHSVNGNVAAGTAPPSSTLANSNLARLVTSNLTGTGSNAGGAGRARSPGGTPTSATQARGSREGSTDAKRRRLNLPASGLRQSSTGPGTPKAGTPQPSGGRAGSVPRGGANKKDAKAGGSNKLLAPPRGGHINPDSKAAKARKKKAGTAGASSRKRGGASGVSDADDSAVSNAGDESGSERLSATGGTAGSGSGGAGTVGRSKDGASDRADRDRDSDDDDDDDDTNHKHDDEDTHMADGHGVDGIEDEDEDDEGGDTNLYCTCRSVSYGNMVACDSDDCPYEWFHWNCVGLTKEPPGKWYCVECKARLGMK